MLREHCLFVQCLHQHLHVDKVTNKFQLLCSFKFVAYSAEYVLHRYYRKHYSCASPWM